MQDVDEANTALMWDLAWDEAEKHDWTKYGDMDQASSNVAFAEGAVWAACWVFAIIGMADVLNRRLCPVCKDYTNGEMCWKWECVSTYS